MHRIRVLSLTIVIVAVVAGLAVPAVLAKGGHPHFLDNTLGFKGGSPLEAWGSVAGLANETYWVVLKGWGSAEAACVNPAGSNQVPGRNPLVDIEVESEAKPVETGETGRASFTVTVDLTTAVVPPSPHPKDVGCPNGSWTVVLGKVTWTKGCLFLCSDERCTDPTDPLDQVCRSF